MGSVLSQKIIDFLFLYYIFFLFFFFIISLSNKQDSLSCGS